MQELQRVLTIRQISCFVSYPTQTLRIGSLPELSNRGMCEFTQTEALVCSKLN